MSWFRPAVALVLALVGSAPLAAQQLDHGLWYDSENGVRLAFATEADGRIVGRIRWVRDSLPDDGPALDIKNPDPSLRSRPIIGLPMVTGMRAERDGSWGDGRIYDARSGKTYRATMTLSHPDTLRIRGYVKIGFVKFGRTAVWVRQPGHGQ